ncbi:dephospho-CoA kinase [uncultured Phascolarctobacterium sp.]|uniref:dephospho-CoA kinase n=1 Tax=uncultured Phascolarctobacterium sp. TaxID=512296 RepID=UPI00262E90A9|nr:dephospho-CoA kinase [uncultured Phascolarctobacterium sp.]
MKIIGLTGGIASGKSTVSAELRRLGVPVFDADQEAKDAVAKGSEGLALVVQAFGAEYLTADGEMDRAKISALVFSDKQALKTLEAILHKIVWQNAEKFLQQCRQKGVQAAVLDVPLLIETGWHKQADSVWLVAVSREQQIKRAMLRSGMTEDEVAARIAAQMSLEEKKKYADVILDNSGSLEATLAAVHRELAQLVGDKSDG